jgi:predicted short-subunit dehydrogenase-like oxidoreductase (DUF2520 family)
MRSLAIIGVGRVGGAFALALPGDQFSVDLLVTRTGNLSPAVSKALPNASVADAVDTVVSRWPKIVLITTRDPEIVGVADSLVDRLPVGTFVFHTSGSYPSSILSKLSDSGCRIGSIHPLVSISDPELGPERFKNSYFCVEGDPDAVGVGEEIVRSVEGRPFSIDTKFKTLYHGAAVTACGHLVALFDAAVDMMTRAGLSAEDAKKILLPLVTSTVKNLETQSLSEALTGTFARADAETFTRHIAALNQYGTDELLEIYLLLGERSLELAAKQGVSSERIETMRTKVAVAKSKLKW